MIKLSSALLFGLSLAIAVTLRLARREAPALFAVPAVISRLFTYHRAHDDVLLAFAMLEVSRRALAGTGSAGWQALWAAAGLSRWLPYSLYVARPLQVYQLAS